jgi:hypothetical protein
MKPINFSDIVDGRKYDTQEATLLAGDDFWDGHNFERSGTNTFLYRTEKGNYFTLRMSMWAGASTSIEPVEDDEARAVYEAMRERRVSYKVAFPNFIVEDA